MIIREFRLPKAITAVLAGVSLSASGLLMQTIFRNPLAGPYVLGISAGASLGVAILILGVSFIPGIVITSSVESWGGILAGWLGAAIILFVILIVTVRIRDIMTILILGIMFGSATSALVSILQYFSPKSELKSYVIWTMGNLGGVSNEQLLILTPVILTGLLIPLVILKPLNVILMGENYAKTLGVNVRRVQVLVFISTSVLAGSITAFCGPVGFIGIAVPHITRMIYKSSDHRVLFPGVLISGAIIMLVSDIISKWPASNLTLPLNSVTALIGIPVVIYVILKSRKIV
jgi:iron complex transport system permease protein